MVKKNKKFNAAIIENFYKHNLWMFISPPSNNQEWLELIHTPVFDVRYQSNKEYSLLKYAIHKQNTVQNILIFLL